MYRRFRLCDGSPGGPCTVERIRERTLPVEPGRMGTGTEPVNSAGQESRRSFQKSLKSPGPCATMTRTWMFRAPPARKTEERSDTP